MKYDYAMMGFPSSKHNHQSMTFQLKSILIR